MSWIYVSKLRQSELVHFPRWCCFIDRLSPFCSCNWLVSTSSVHIDWCHFIAMSWLIWSYNWCLIFSLQCLDCISVVEIWLSVWWVKTSLYFTNRLDVFVWNRSRHLKGNTRALKIHSRHVGRNLSGDIVWMRSLSVHQAHLAVVVWDAIEVGAVVLIEASVECFATGCCTVLCPGRA